MIAITRVDQPLTLAVLDDVGCASPVVYVMFLWPGLEDAVARIFSSSEPGESLVIADFDSASQVAKRFGAKSAQSMLGFAIHTFTGFAAEPEHYASVIQESRDWRRRQTKAEKREWDTHGALIKSMDIVSVPAIR